MFEPNFKAKWLIAMSKHGLFATILISTGWLVGCSAPALNTPYQRPALALPGAVTVPSTLVASPGPGGVRVDWLAWWKAFGDPVLDGFLQEAERQSQDLVLASARIAEARAALQQNQSNFYPSVDLNANASRRRGSESAASYNASAGPFSNDRLLGLSASYEIDFWGKYAAADQAAQARLLAQAASRGTVLTTLYASVAQGYFALRALDAQVLLAEQTLVTRQDNERLQKRRFAGGVASELDWRQAESESLNAQLALEQARMGRANAQSALALLLGRQPRDILNPVLARGEALSDLAQRQALPADLPSDVLARRPDVVAAEHNLVAAHSDIGQARAAYFPRLSLTTSLGQQSRDFSRLFDPGSMFWSLLGNLTMPIFRAGAIDAVVAAANAREQQAVAQYTQAVQNAFRDVHDALSNTVATREIARSSARRVEAMHHNLRLAELRERAGYSSPLELLNARRDWVQAQSSLVDAQRNQLGAVVSLYKALGGGWDAATLVGQSR